MSSTLCFITLVLSYFLHKCNTVYVGDSVTRMKMKMLHMDRELVLNAIRNVQKVEYIKDYYTPFPTYEIGRLIYRIRSKFARMTRVYILSCDNLEDYSHNKLIENMNEIQKIALEAIHLVEVLEEWESKAEKRKKQIPSYLKKKNMTLPITTFSPTNGTATNISVNEPPNQQVKHDRDSENAQLRNNDMGKGKVYRGMRNKASHKRYKISIDGLGFDSDIY